MIVSISIHTTYVAFTNKAYGYVCMYIWYNYRYAMHLSVYSPTILFVVGDFPFYPTSKKEK